MSSTQHTEIHPDWYYDIPVMHTLVLGSFPPHPSKRKVDFYYPNPQNHFWRILAAVAGFTLNRQDDTVEKRKAIMRQLKTGVQNMGKTIQRQGNSSKDTDISIVEYQDILSIIHRHPELKTILLPGFSAASSTYHSFVKYLLQHHIAVPAIKKPNHETWFYIQVGNHQIKCAVLNSTSPLTAIPFDRLVAQFKKHIVP